MPAASFDAQVTSLAQTASHLTIRHVRHVTCDADMKKKMVANGGGGSDPSQRSSGNDLQRIA